MNLPLLPHEIKELVYDAFLKLQQSVYFENTDLHLRAQMARFRATGLETKLDNLADQISQTANQSATQVSALAHNLEQLAARLSHTRQETENVSRALEQRLAAVEKTAEDSAHALQQRLAEGIERLPPRIVERSPSRSRWCRR